MFEIKCTYSEFQKDYPNILKKFLSDVQHSYKNEGNVELSNINFYYYWTIYSEEIPSYILDLKYEDRISYEIKNRLKIEVYMKYGNYIRGEYISDIQYIPESILDNLKKSMISTMIYEQFNYGNKEVVDSIPLSEGISLELEYESDEDEDDNWVEHPIDSLDEEIFDIDKILDKISEYGFDGLSEDEKKFLEEYKKSDE